jgi:hypothetical protein
VQLQRARLLVWKDDEWMMWELGVNEVGQNQSVLQFVRRHAPVGLANFVGRRERYEANG